MTPLGESQHDDYMKHSPVDRQPHEADRNDVKSDARPDLSQNEPDQGRREVAAALWGSEHDQSHHVDEHSPCAGARASVPLPFDLPTLLEGVDDRIEFVQSWHMPTKPEKPADGSFSPYLTPPATLNRFPSTNRIMRCPRCFRVQRWQFESEYYDGITLHHRYKASCGCPETNDQKSCGVAPGGEY